MANTYTQITIHIVFAVKGRENFIKPVFKDEIFKYIAGIIRNKQQKLLCINGMPDHLHILIGLEPTMALSDLVRDIKANSSRWMNEQRWLPWKFEWQSGFGAFSYSRSQRPQDRMLPRCRPAGAKNECDMIGCYRDDAPLGLYGDMGLISVCYRDTALLGLKKEKYEEQHDASHERYCYLLRIFPPGCVLPFL